MTKEQHDAMVCPVCNKKLSQQEADFMFDYGYTACVDCREKREKASINKATSGKSRSNNPRSK